MNAPSTPSTPKRARLRPRTIIGILIAVGSAVTVIGCVRQSGKVIYFHEAELPQGWPLLTEVGVIEVKEYPQYREAVVVREIAPRTYASVGVRGSINDKNFEHGLVIVNAWIAANPQWRADGTPRFFGYNSPLIPWFWKYGEVQVPVVASAKTSS